MRVAFVASNYPSASRPAVGSFVRQFVWAMARQGHECSVIAPVSVFERKHGPLPPRFAVEDAGAGPAVQVHRLRHVSFSSRKVGAFHTGRWSNAAFAAAVLRTLSRLPRRPDVVYGHFMYPAGHAAIRAARRSGAHSVVGVGEGEFWTLKPVGDVRARREMGAASAVLAVSTDIRNELVGRLEIPAEKIRVFPNGVDLRAFRPTADRAARCRELGFPENDFLVGYVGPFVAQKGYPQLRAAVEDLAGVRLVLLGRGPLPPEDSRIAFRGSVPHGDVPRFLGACHAFVLPTRIEGSCNSVIEAMACGLPLVTSRGSFMDDVVDADVALRVDPDDVAAIRAAIVALRDDPELRARMSAACLRKARQFDVDERARRIGAWFESLGEARP